MVALGMSLGLVFSRGSTVAPPPVSITAPSVGSSVLATWNLQYSGTGPRTSASNGTWPNPTPVPGTQTNIPAYLTASGRNLQWDNFGTLWFNIGAGNVTVANYDFTGAPCIGIAGTGSITFVDCVFTNISPLLFSSTAIYWPSDINRNIDTTPGYTLQPIFQYCSFRSSAFYAGSGTAQFTNCRWDYMRQGAGDCGAGAYVTLTDCYLPGIGTNPPASSHIEITQYNATTPRVYTLLRCMVDAAAQGQASIAATVPPFGWTSFVSCPGSGNVSIDDSIFIGLPAINANPNTGVVAEYALTLNPASINRIVNCVFETGRTGYGTGAGAGVTFSGNRSLANAALTTANFP